MTRSESRLIRCLGVVLLVPVVFVLLFMLFDTWAGGNDTSGFLLAGTFSFFALAAPWWLIWRRNVLWTRHRIVITAASVPGTGLLYITVFFAITGIADVAAAILAFVAWITAWMVTTAYVWRETHHEQVRRASIHPSDALPCPSCGYDMRGLHTLTCPECGTHYTVDDLLVAVTTRRGTQQAATGED